MPAWRAAGASDRGAAIGINGMYFRERWACFASLLAVVVVGATDLAAQPTVDNKTAVGYSALLARLGAAAPTGASVPVTQVEVGAGASLDYGPNQAHADFSGKTFTLKSGSSGSSDHATGVGRNYYGNQSFAPGINQIDLYEVDNWLQTGGLKFLQSVAPAVETQRVQNHSWIASGLLNSQAIDLLRRLDYQIQRDNVVSVVGVNNGSSSAFPQLLANSYNAITVGRTSGGSSIGPSTLDVAGRAAVNLVAPAGNVSTAVPWVAGSAALLIEAAGANVEAAKSQTIRAVLMAGATKDEFDTTNQTPSTFDNWTRTPTRPLDLRYGAGELNIDNAHRILTSPQQEASAASLVNSTGWDFDNISGGTSQLYFFEIPLFTQLDSLSIIAAWNRDIAFTPGTGGSPALFTPSLANVDLKLFQANSFTLGSMIDQSISTIDNVEHIFQRGLAPGRYAIQMLSDATVDVALAWDSILTLLDVPGDGNGDRRVTGADFTIWSDNFGLFNGDAQTSNGDYNGDGYVTGADFTVWSDYFGTDASVNQIAASRAVPEPGAARLAAWALWAVVGAGTAARRRVAA